MSTPVPDKIIADINQEREHAQKYWDPDFDACNTVNDWGTYINIYLARATKMRDKTTPFEQYSADQRKALVKVANLAIAALETFDENDGFPDRHYD